MAHFIIRSRVVICILLLVGPLLLPVERADAQVGATPLLRSVSMTSPVSAEITLLGDGFSPGGLVRIAVYDLWGGIDFGYATFVASSATYGPSGSQDPAQGYTSGGLVDGRVVLNPESTSGPNGSQDSAQGYIPGSSSANSIPVFSTQPIFYPNGTRDADMPYDAGAPTTQSGVTCVRDVMVRAYDFKTQAWSNLLDVKAGC